MDVKKIVAILVLLASSKVFSNSDTVLYSWVQMGPGSQQIARAIMQGDSNCPFIVIDNASEQMHVRASASNDFPVTVCEFILPEDIHTVQLSDKVLPLLPKQTERIAVIGDTGCRIKNNYAQACNDLKKWPFASTAQQIVATKPDLVIHVGDIFYRETACPKNFVGCKGSPYGDNWATWEADFFKPAQGLLAVAPWLIVRGNHESCDRGWRGWFRLLDPYPLTNIEKCEVTQPMYSVELGNKRLHIIDTASITNEFNEDMASKYSSIYKKLNETDTPTWILQHHPLWGLRKIKDQVIISSKTLQAAAGETVSNEVELILSGHIHASAIYNYGTFRPQQLIVGMAGTKVDSFGDFTRYLLNVDVSGRKVLDGYYLIDKGFVLLTLDKSSDSIDYRYISLDGNIVKHYLLQGRLLYEIYVEGSGIRNHH